MESPRPPVRDDAAACALAGFRPRLVAFGYDYLVIASYLAALVAVAAALLRFAPEVPGALFGHPVTGQATAFALVTLPVALYFALSEASPRRGTWGRGRAELAVTDRRGGRVGMGRALARTALKLLPWELAHLCIWQVRFASDPESPVYLAGFFVVWGLVAVDVAGLFRGPPRAVHDRLTGTQVVYSPGRRAQETAGPRSEGARCSEGRNDATGPDHA